MTTNYTLPDGRDLSQVFETGDAGISTGYSTSNGVDLGRQFMGGASGVVTGYKNPAGIDVGSLFGASMEAQGYTKATIHVQQWTERILGNTWVYTGYYRYYGKGSISDASLLGTSGAVAACKVGATASFICTSSGTKQTSVVVDGRTAAFVPDVTGASAEFSSLDREHLYTFMQNHVNQDITIWVK